MKKRNDKTAGLILIFLFAFASSAMAAPPTDPSNLRSLSHAVGVSSTNNIIKISWTPSTDPDGNMEGYYTKWDHSPNTINIAENRLDASATFTQSAPLQDAPNWYFHIRAFDDDFNRSNTIHLGPFIIDTQPNITSVMPTGGIENSLTVVTIVGTDFMSNATVKIGDTDMVNIEFVNATTLKATVPGGMSPGIYPVQVSNPNTKNDTKENAFRIVSANPPKGDVNGDTAIDLADAILSLQVFAGLHPEWIQIAADVNGDDSIGLEEAIYALQKALGIRN